MKLIKLEVPSVSASAVNEHTVRQLSWEAEQQMRRVYFFAFGRSAANASLKTMLDKSSYCGVTFYPLADEARSALRAFRELCAAWRKKKTVGETYLAAQQVLKRCQKFDALMRETIKNGGRLQELLRVDDQLDHVGERPYFGQNGRLAQLDYYPLDGLEAGTAGEVDK